MYVCVYVHVRAIN